MHSGESGSEVRDDRRSFVGRVFTWMGLTALGMSLASTVYANFRFFFPKVLYEPPPQFKAGYPADYQPATVSDRWVKEHQVWMVRDGAGNLYALLTTCTHLGCLTGFFPAEALFKCPCHGSNFSLAGDPVAGPAPVPLYHLSLSLGEDGQIVVDKNRRENRAGPRDEPPFVLKV
jgi:cytochrome b6-f complex iron-sulfur subunit